MPTDEHGSESPLRRVITGASIGNAVEWYDFAIYGFLATVISVKFFPPGNETAALLNTFAIFAAAFFFGAAAAVFFFAAGRGAVARPPGLARLEEVLAAPFFAPPRFAPPAFAPFFAVFFAVAMVRTSVLRLSAR